MNPSIKNKPNRLIREKSPYLLQHAYNPVSWYPWGKEAFHKAREENKLVFLSIGYSACHWCHVMEKESFEDPVVARLLNQYFVSIKVDREERPDVDGVYMNVCQMLTQRGGWPLTIIMTPDKRPFFAATYLPKTSRFRQPGLLELIPRIGQLWASQKEELALSADRITSALQASAAGAQTTELGEVIFHKTFQSFSQTYDEQHGGFGPAPKFPAPHILSFLLRYWNRTMSERALHMVKKTLASMRRGGIFDHVGFGFHRYSTDSHWLLPHFEKMLYDQALLAVAYTEAYQATKLVNYKDVTEEIFTYVLSHMTSPEGGFYSAEDADSEGEEGKFYTWFLEDIKNILNPEETALAVRLYNLEAEGNFHDEATGDKSGRNVLHLKEDLAKMSSALGLDTAGLRNKMETIRRILWTSREKRIPPLRDEKILTDWNGLMIAALAKGGRCLDNRAYIKAAQEAAEFIISKMSDGKNGLFHRYKDGQAAIAAYADDYAFFIWGLLELYESTFSSHYLEKALELNRFFLKHYWDEPEGGFYFTADEAEPLLLRKKEIYDGAIPSSNSVAMLNLLKLGRITANPDLEDKANQSVKFFSGDITQNPTAYTQTLSTLDFSLESTHEVVIVGDTRKNDTMEMIRAIRSIFAPHTIVLLVPAEEKSPDIFKLAPFTAAYKAIDGKATAYVCSGYACKNPTTKPELMLEQLMQP